MILTIILITIVTILKAFWDSYTIEVKKRNFNHAWRNVLAGATMFSLSPFWKLTSVELPYMAWCFSAYFHFVFFDYILNFVRIYAYGNKNITWYHLGKNWTDRIWRKFGNIYTIIILKLLVGGLIFLSAYALVYYIVTGDIL